MRLAHSAWDKLAHTIIQPPSQASGHLRMLDHPNPHRVTPACVLAANNSKQKVSKVLFVEQQHGAGAEVDPYKAHASHMCIPHLCRSVEGDVASRSKPMNRGASLCDAVWQQNSLRFMHLRPHLSCAFKLVSMARPMPSSTIKSASLAQSTTSLERYRRSITGRLLPVETTASLFSFKAPLGIGVLAACTGSISGACDMFVRSGNKSRRLDRLAQRAIALPNSFPHGHASMLRSAMQVAERKCWLT